MLETRTVIPVLESDDQGGVTRSAGRYQTVSATQGITLQFRNRFHFLLHLLHDLGVLMQSGSFRHTHLAHDNTLVLLRYETGRHDLHEQHEQRRGYRQQQERQGRTFEVFLHRTPVLAEDGIEARLIRHFRIVIDALPFWGFGCACLRVRSQQNRTQSRTEDECAHARQTYRTGDRDTELSKERTTRTAHERHWDKHRHEHKRTRYDGHRHLTHCFAGCLNRLIFRRSLHLTRFQFRHHGLDDDDGIIDDGSDSEHQGEQSQYIQREPG